MAYYCCFRLGGNQDFLEFLQKTFYNINYWKKKSKNEFYIWENIERKRERERERDKDNLMLVWGRDVLVCDFKGWFDHVRLCAFI